MCIRSSYWMPVISALTTTKSLICKFPVMDITTHNPQIRSTNPRSCIYHENCGLCGAFWIETYNPLLIQFYWIFFLNAYAENK